MADTKISALTALDSFVTGDLLPMVDDPAGTPVTKKATIDQVKTFVSSSPTLVTPALGTPSSGTLTNCTGLPVAGITASTSTALGVGSIELGHASDTTISRASAGVIAVEGVNVITTANISDTAYGSAWDGVTTIAPSKNAVYDKFQANAIAPISTAWASLLAMHETQNSALAANTIYYTPVWLPRRTTISDLGFRVNTAGVGNGAAAIYANNASTNQPTGTPLAATGNINVNVSNTFVSADITGADVTLDPGLYWTAVWSDVTPNVFCNNYNATSCFVGSTTAGDVLNSGGFFGYSYSSAETYNASAWPDAASETLSAVPASTARRNYSVLIKVV